MLIFTTCFTKFRESSNVNPNTSLIIVTSGKAAPSANRWLYIGFRARTSTLHFSVFKIILFSRNHLHTSSSSLLRLYELHEQFFYPIREFFRLARAHSYFLRETSTWHVVSCPPGDTWYGMILSSVGVVSSRLGLKSECAVFFFLTELSLVVTPYWRAAITAKQLSMATIPLCFEFFRCRVELSCKVNFHVIRSALQYSGTFNFNTWLSPWQR